MPPGGGVRAIRLGVKAVGQQPGIGRPIEDMPDDFREWIIDSAIAAAWLVIVLTPMP